MKSVDFHNHVLGHKYYFGKNMPEELDNSDKLAIRIFVEDLDERGLDYVAVTDHDMLISGLYAKEYAIQKGIRTKIIPGMECEVSMLGQYIHIQGLGLEEAPVYEHDTDPVELIKAIQELGGIAILAHPHMYYLNVYHNLKHHLDGVEYVNGGVQGKGISGGYYEMDNDPELNLIKTYGSDWHFPSEKSRSQNGIYTDMSEEFLKKLAGY